MTDELEIELMMATIKTKQLKMFGHIPHINESRQVWKSVKKKSELIRLRGRPKKTWKKVDQKILLKIKKMLAKFVSNNCLILYVNTA